MDQRKLVLLADASEEFRTMLREEIEKRENFLLKLREMGMKF